MLAGVGIISFFWDVSEFLQYSFDALTGYIYPHICLHRFVCLIQVQSDHLKVTSRTTRNCWSKILTRHPFQWCDWVLSLAQIQMEYLWWVNRITNKPATYGINLNCDFWIVVKENRFFDAQKLGDAFHGLNVLLEQVPSWNFARSWVSSKKILLDRERGT